MRKLILYFITFDFCLLPFALVAKAAHAVCPVCTIAVGAGLGLSRYLGIDDIISGLWVGGLILSSALWFADWLHKRGIGVKINVLNIASCVAFYLIVIVPLYLTGIMGHPYNMIYGMDRLLFGIIIGSIIFILAVSLDKMVRKVNGRQLFPYEKVVFPLFSLIIMSVILYIGLKI